MRGVEQEGELEQELAELTEGRGTGHLKKAGGMILKRVNRGEYERR